jgi:Ser-tRNA(Ala) deacylase AlaX
MTNFIIFLMMVEKFVKIELIENYPCERGHNLRCKQTEKINEIKINKYT